MKPAERNDDTKEKVRIEKTRAQSWMMRLRRSWDGGRWSRAGGAGWGGQARVPRLPSQSGPRSVDGMGNATSLGITVSFMVMKCIIPENWRSDLSPHYELLVRKFP